MALLLAQVLAGAVLLELRLRSATRGIHLALASALWAATAVLAMLVRPGTLRSEASSSPLVRPVAEPASPPPRTPQSLRRGAGTMTVAVGLETTSPSGRRGLRAVARDYLSLTK